YVQSLLNITTLHLRLKGKYLNAGFLLLLSSIVNAVMVYASFDWFGKTYESRINSFLFSSIIILVFIVFLSIRDKNIKIKIDFSFLNRDILLFCLPLCLTMIINWVKG
ncbi:TPA: O24 family O-antigen flippase, partial [Escherichia coli]